ncbi:hypothetical protein Ahy_B01g055219 [Arachis hypogaea]|uniref:Uncharacterized protein n=1 Tax=Arachis hypogaea TaxID=3818 RepID=A0A445AVL1_ARAHY|nr:hypothetical protein Ahy_B01g055219 [Arachis hypogaea]
MLQRYHALPECQPPPPIKRLRSPTPQLLPPPHQWYSARFSLPIQFVVLSLLVEILDLEFAFKLTTMRRQKTEPSNSRRFRLSQFLFAIRVLYLVFISCTFPQILKIVSTISRDDIYDGLDGAAIVGGSKGSKLSKPFVSSVYRFTSPEARG